MKRIIAILLCATILLVSSEMPSQHAQAQLGPALFVLAAAGGACMLLFWVWKTVEEPRVRCVVLQKSYYDGNWINVATNVMLIPPHLTKAFPAFYERMTDQVATYRVIEVPMNPQVAPGYLAGATARPFIYP
jgi:hypothetical protein